MVYEYKNNVAFRVTADSKSGRQMLATKKDLTRNIDANVFTKHLRGLTTEQIAWNKEVERKKNERKQRNK